MKKILSMVLTIIIVCAGVLTSVSASDGVKFSDVDNNHWAYECVETLSEKGVIAGYPDGTFKPEAEVSRGEWIKMICIAAGCDVNVEYNNTYDDIVGDEWYAPYVTASDYCMPVESTDEGEILFAAENKASRESVATSLVNMKGYVVEAADVNALDVFADSSKVSEYNRSHIAMAVQKNLIKGFEDGTFRPLDTLTRAEAATLLYRAFYDENVKQQDVIPDDVKEKVRETVAFLIEKYMMLDESGDRYIDDLWQTQWDSFALLLNTEEVAKEDVDKALEKVVELTRKVGECAELQLISMNVDGDYARVKFEVKYPDVNALMEEQKNELMTDEERATLQELDLWQEYNEELSEEEIMASRIELLNKYTEYMKKVIIRILPEMELENLSDAEVLVGEVTMLLEKTDGKWHVVYQYGLENL